MKSSKAKKDSKFQYGEKDVLDESYRDPRNHSHRISILVEGDLLEAIKARAASVGAPYQTYMKKVLRDSLGATESLEKRVEKLEKAIRRKVG